MDVQSAARKARKIHAASEKRKNCIKASMASKAKRREKRANGENVGRSDRSWAEVGGRLC